MHLIAASDHGHVTVHARADLFETLEAAGLRCGPAPAAGIDAIVIPGQLGAIYRRAIGRRYPPHCRIDDRAALVWSGAYRGWRGLWHCSGQLCPPFGVRRPALSADILFSFRSDGLDPFGVMGRTLSADGAVGFGVHGGWHANEMSSVGILAGPLIEKRLRLASSLRHLRHCADRARSSGPFATGNDDRSCARRDLYR